MPKSLVVDVNEKNKGGICVFVPVFVIDGSLAVDVENKVWTEAWTRSAAAAASQGYLAIPPLYWPHNSLSAVTDRKGNGFIRQTYTAMVPPPVPYGGIC